MAWIEVSRNGARWFQLDTDFGYITLQDRSEHCFRGQWIAKVNPRPQLVNPWFDDAGGWPRYFFDKDRAQAECEAWVAFREQVFKDKQATRRPRPEA